MNTPQQIPVAQLTPHPNNRLATGYNQDRINTLAGWVSDGMDVCYALKVRPMDGGYQVVTGNHRYYAALKAGIETVPCWVREMSDEETLILVATDNEQDPPSPLDYGMYALEFVKISKGGRGQKGGLSEYARAIGRDQGNVSRLSQAAEVCLNSCTETYVLQDKTRHLSAIHALPESTWPDAVEHMLKQEWSAKETGEQVKAANEGSTDKRVLALFTGQTSTNKLSRIDAIRDHVADLLADHEDLISDWLAWFEEEDPIDLRDVQNRQLEYENIKYEREHEEEESTGPTIYHATADQLMEYMENNGLQYDVLLTDPPYMTDVEDITTFAIEWLPRALALMKPTGRAYVCVGAYPQELAAYFAAAMPEQVLVWTYRNTLGPAPKDKYKLNWQAILYYKGDDAPALNCPEMVEQFSVKDINAPDARHEERYHTWEKPLDLADMLIRHSTKPGDIVLDLFAGTGTFILAAEKQNRQAIGCESDADMLEIAEKRGCKSYGLQE